MGLSKPKLAFKRPFRSFIVNNQGTVGLALAALSVAQVSATLASNLPVLAVPSPASMLLWVTAVLAVTVRLATAD